MKVVYVIITLTSRYLPRNSACTEKQQRKKWVEKSKADYKRLPAGFHRLTHSEYCCFAFVSCVLLKTKFNLKRLPTHTNLRRVCQARGSSFYRFCSTSRLISFYSVLYISRNCLIAVSFWVKQNLNYEYKDISSSANFRAAFRDFGEDFVKVIKISKDFGQHCFEKTMHLSAWLRKILSLC